MRMPKKTVLIVDDDVDLVATLAMRCQSIGMNVKTAHDSLTAVRMMDAEMPDLICLDVNMPTGNGLAICEAMNTDPITAKIPVIIMTACCSPETVKRCGDLCAYYVHKSGELWRRIEPVIQELVDLGPIHEESIHEESIH